MITNRYTVENQIYSFLRFCFVKATYKKTLPHGSNAGLSFCKGKRNTCVKNIEESSKYKRRKRTEHSKSKAS